jgi:hypothetical protein
MIATPFNWQGKRLPAGLFAALWSLDAILSSIMVTRYGTDMEANPVMLFVMVEAGLLGFLAIKAAILCVWLYLAPYVRPWLLWAVTVAMAWPVVAGAIIVAGS